MKNKILVIVFFVVFLIYSCSEKNRKYLVFKNVQHVECISIPYSDILGISMQLLKKDSLLLINDFYGDSLIHVFDVKNQVQLSKLVAKGNGPNEFISPLGIYMTDDKLFINERQSFRLFSFPLDSLLSNNKNIKKEFTITKSNIIFPLSDSLFISSGYGEGQKRFTLYGKGGAKICEFGEYPTYWHEETKFSNKVRSFFHQTFFEKHPSQKKFIAYTGHILGIYSYELTREIPVLEKEFLLSDYKYSFVDNDQILTADGTEGIEHGIIRVACSSNYIYILYNPNKKGKDITLPYQIKILDWDGNPIKLIAVNKQISCFVIDETEKKGYIVARDPEDTLMYFNLEN